MTASILRRAAALMRRRASAATPGPWEAYVLGSEGYDVRGPQVERPLRPRRIARCGYETWEADRANAEHIAGMHPAVALAVADWLDAEASIQSMYPDRDDDDIENALRVARTYLGESA